MLRELERPSSRGVSVRVVIPADADGAERVAEHALGTVVHFLDLGAPVVLHTVEASGPVSAVVADRRAAGRRLARAVAGGGEDLSGVPGVAVTP
jgi:ABC-type sugar transport system substrate-binding protein